MTNDLLSSPTARSDRTVARVDPLLVDIGVGLLYLFAMMPGLAHSLFLADGDAHVRAAEVGLAATSSAAGALMLRRRIPITTLCVCVVLLLIVKTLMFGSPDPLGLAIAGYAVAAYPARRTAFAAVPISVAIIALTIVVGVPWTQNTISVGVLLVLNLVVFIPACLLGLIITALSMSRRSAEPLEFPAPNRALSPRP